MCENHLLHAARDFFFIDKLVLFLLFPLIIRCFSKLFIQTFKGDRTPLDTHKLPCVMHVVSETVNLHFVIFEIERELFTPQYPENNCWSCLSRIILSIRMLIWVRVTIRNEVGLN